jgi:ABC-2 family transporter protein
MTWLVWRQHRQQALAAVVAMLAVALFLVPTGRQMHAAFDDLGLRRCLPGAGPAELVAPDGGCASLSEQFSARFQGLATTSLLLLFLPVLAGMFWGAPLVAREVEHGTHRLVWTQGVTRLRWATVKLALVGGGVVLVAAAYAALVGWWVAPLNDATGYRFTWLFFDQQGPVLVGYALFAFALGVLVGTMTRKVQPAMAITLGGYLATRVAVALLVRPRFLPYQRRAYPTVSGSAPAPEPNQLAGDWVISRAVYSAQGVKLTPGSGSQALCDQATAPSCVAKYGAGAYNQELFQPADRFWLFQGIETALFVVLAVVLLALAVRLVRRRIA